MVEQILKLTEVKSITKLSGSTIYRLIDAGEFPRQIRLTENGRSSGWISSEVYTWLEGRIAASRNEEAA